MGVKMKKDNAHLHKNAHVEELALINAEEDTLFEFQYLLFDLLREKDISKAELANRLGISRARMSQLFSSGANPTLKTASRCLAALGYKLQLEGSEQSKKKIPVATSNNFSTASFVRDLMNACISEGWNPPEVSNADYNNFEPEKQVA